MACVRYWAAARETAGVVTEPVAGSTLGQVLAAVSATHGPRMAALVARSVLLVDGAQVNRGQELTLSADAEVEILPPYAGGSA